MVTISADITGLGSAAYTGSIAFNGNSSTVSGNVVLSLSPLQPPYFAGQQSFLLEPSGATTITMPDGSQLSGASNQLLLFFDSTAALADEQAVASLLAANGASVVGAIPSAQMIQIQVQDTSTVGALIAELQANPKIAHVGPNLFEAASQSGSCGEGPIPTQGPTGWVQADHLAPAPANSDDVVIGIVDEFATKGQPPMHGDVVTSYVLDATGSTSAKPVFQVGANVFQLPAGSNGGNITKTITDFVNSNPGKHIVINLSRQAATCDGSNPAFDLAACAKGNSELYQQYNALSKTFGDRVIIVRSAGNAPVSVLPQTSLSSCRFIPVGGLDQTSPEVTLSADFSIGAPIPVYAPANNISPVSLAAQPPFCSGTSFAAPQVAGQLAAIWAAGKNTGLSACQLGSQIFALPKLGPGQTGAQFDGGALADRATNLQPSTQAPNAPLSPLPCPAIDVSPSSTLLNVGQSVHLTATATGATTQPTFRYLTDNPRTATVDTSGNVTAVNTGVTTIFVSAPGITCAGQAAIAVPAEKYAGTFSINAMDTAPNAPGWTPDPITTTATVTGAPVQITVAQSLLTSGVFTGILTIGPGTVTVSIPGQSCSACNPPLTIPPVNDSSPLPALSGAFTGTSDGKLLSIPLADGFPPITGTVSVLGPNVVVNLDWSFQQDDGAGGTLNLHLSGSLNKL